MTLHRIASGHYFVDHGEWQYRIQHVAQIEYDPRLDVEPADGSTRFPWVVLRSATPRSRAYRGSYRTLREARAAIALLDEEWPPHTPVRRPAMTGPITWTEGYPGCEYRVHTPIGEFDAWSSPTAFVKADAWFVADAGTGRPRWSGQSFEQALEAIRSIVEETAS